MKSTIVDNRHTRNSFRHMLELRAVKLLWLLSLIAAFALAWYLSYAQALYASAFSRRGNLAVIAFYAVLLFYFIRTYDGLNVSLNRVSEMVYSQTLAGLFTNAITYALICLLERRLPSAWPLLLCMVAQALLSVLWSACANKWYFRHFPPLKTVIIQGELTGYDLLIRKYDLHKKFEVIRTAYIDDYIEEGVGLLDDAEAVFLVGLHSHERNQLIKYCVSENIRVFIKPRLGDIIMDATEEMHIMHLPIKHLRRYNPKPEYRMIKRLFDIVSASLLFLLTSPIFLVTAIAIKAYDGGPVFYKQIRLTKDAREFEVLKFRSMRADAEKDGVARLSTGENDSRITPVGRIIRKIRVDELPQLLNIIKGDMSVVGPRPERPEIARKYEEELPEFKLRLQAKAGLTGYAQVYGKYNTTPYDKLCMDLMYIAHASVALDLKLIFATVKILFLPESTEGVAEGATTAMDYENAAGSTENDAETVAK